MNVANVTVTDKGWVDLEELISETNGSAFTFTLNQNYYVVNCGGSNVLFLNQEEKPSDDVRKGLTLADQEQLGLKLANGKVFVRSLCNSVDIHIEMEG